MKILSLLGGCLCGALVVGCTTEPNQVTTGTDSEPATEPDPDPSTGTGTTAGPSTDVAPTTESSESGDPPTTSTDGPTASTTDGGLQDDECDPWAQDCPDGYKCMAYAEEGEPAFTGTKCTQVVADPAAAGDTCKVDGGWWTGIDDCDYGLACWNINHDTNEGQCIPLCTGTAEAYDCPGAKEVCVFWVPGLAHVCLPNCDPLLQDCDPGQACLPDYASGFERWVCLAEYSFEEGQEFDDCQFSNVCNPGLVCWDPAFAMECADAEGGCCIALCDLNNPVCNGEGAECQPFYDMDPPPEHADVGLCGLPG